MYSINKQLVCLLIFISFVQASYASDEIHLTSGDRIYGLVTEISQDHVVIDTAFAKQLKIEHELIEEMKTQQAIEIVFENGESVQAVIEKTQGADLNYYLEGEAKPLKVNQLAINPREVIAATNALPPEIKYSGKLDVGLSRSSGNEDDEDYHGALMLQARTLENRYTLEASKTIEKNDGDKTQDETYGALQLDHFISKKWYAFISASFEEDLEELLNLRSTYSLGSGYQFFEQEDLSLKAEIGLAYVDEDFEEDNDNQYAGGRWAVNYEHDWVKWLGFFHDHEGFFSLENSDDINIRSSTGFKFPLNKYINARLHANIDWNRSPAEGATGTDKEYIFTLGYEF